ncbi:MAG TPA: DUF4442 domain-containing protein [Bdellovibrionales bacterium]|nr:DUF4442 domain-containing protein [Bdellovibrionales bacterium]
MSKSWKLKLINFWPPYFGAGVRVKRIAPDLRAIDVEMKLRFWNQNYVGTHFGGSLYAMTDPFIMLMLIENLGRDYIVWDKAALIQFKKPGKGKVSARFALTANEIDEIRAQADREYKIEPKFTVSVTDESGETVALVEKTLYVRRKDRKKGEPSRSTEAGQRHE